MKIYAKIIVVAIASIFFFSCEDDEKGLISCDVANPTEELLWLKTMIESWEANSPIYTYMYIQQGTYLGQTVFLFGNCCPFCDSYFPVYNCEGEEIELENGQTISDQKIIWKPVGSQCTF